jgi:hypothetical protein
MSLFSTTAPKRGTDRLDCHSVRRASNDKPMLRSNPTSKLSQQYICEKCRTSFTQPDLLWFHKEKGCPECNTPTTIQEPSVPEGWRADRNLTTSDNVYSSYASRRTLMHATLSNKSTQTSSLPLRLSPTRKPIVLTILSIEYIKAFVEVQKGPGQVQQVPRVYSWEDLRSLDGATDAAVEFLSKDSARSRSDTTQEGLLSNI